MRVHGSISTRLPSQGSLLLLLAGDREVAEVCVCVRSCVCGGHLPVNAFCDLSIPSYLANVDPHSLPLPSAPFDAVLL